MATENHGTEGYQIPGFLSDPKLRTCSGLSFQARRCTNRDPCLPRLIRVEHHAQWQFGAAYVFEASGADDLDETATYVTQMEIPDSVDDEELHKQGFFRLPSNSCIFHREKGSKDEMRDIPRIWHYDTESLSEIPGAKDIVRRLVGIRNRIVGSGEHFNGSGERLTEFEALKGRNVQVRDNQRCYSMATSIQRQRDYAFSPSRNAASDPTYHDPDQSGHEFFKEYNSVISQYASLAYHGGPPDWVEQQRLLADLYNIPSIGHHFNTGFFTANQLNISPLSPRQSPLETSLKKAGRVHEDEGDDPASLTTIVSLSEGRWNVHLGCFFVLALGVYVDLREFSTVTFSGRMAHGANEPRFISDHEQDNLKPYFRLVSVCYPPKPVFSGDVNTQLAVGRMDGEGLTKSVIEVGRSLERTAEHLMGNSRQPGCPTSLTFATNGSAVLSGRPLHKFVTYALGDLVTGICRQLPAEEGLHLDYNRLLSAFYVMGPNGSKEYHIPRRTAFPGSDEAAELKRRMENRTTRALDTVCGIRQKQSRIRTEDSHQESANPPLTTTGGGRRNSNRTSSGVRRPADTNTATPEPARKRAKRTVTTAKGKATMRQPRTKRKTKLRAVDSSSLLRIEASLQALIHNIPDDFLLPETSLLGKVLDNKEFYNEPSPQDVIWIAKSQETICGQIDEDDFRPSKKVMILETKIRLELHASAVCHTRYLIAGWIRNVIQPMMRTLVGCCVDHVTGCWTSQDLNETTWLSRLLRSLYKSLNRVSSKTKTIKVSPEEIFIHNSLSSPAPPFVELKVQNSFRNITGKEKEDAVIDLASNFLAQYTGISKPHHIPGAWGKCYEFLREAVKVLGPGCMLLASIRSASGWRDGSDLKESLMAELSADGDLSRDFVLLNNFLERFAPDRYRFTKNVLLFPM
ncbi:hypothetical protein ACEPAG_269 [Sanghuangporus baumii]